MGAILKGIDVGGAAYPLYKVTVNDGTPDGGANCTFIIGVDSTMGSISIADLEAGVQALADSISAHPGYALRSILKILVAETTL